MSVGKSVCLVIGALFLAILQFGCEGDQGSPGPNGFEGPTGPGGRNFTPDPVHAESFGLMITNGTTADFNGAAKVEITSDSTLAPAANRVVARFLARAPRIDGIDQGASEWGNAQSSAITLSPLFGTDNGVSQANVRFGYDRNYLYAQIWWTESATGSFVVGADTLYKSWRFNAGAWQQNQLEDRLYLAWEDGSVTGWDASGISAIFDGATFATAGSGENADLWVWKAGETYYSDLARDMWVDNSGAVSDIGPTITLENVASGGRPSYMRSNSPKSGSPAPLMAFEYAPFVSANGWQSGATIPGYVTMPASGSVADIQAVATFFSNTWIVELRRARNTGHGDDVGL